MITKRAAWVPAAALAVTGMGVAPACAQQAARPVKQAQPPAVGSVAPGFTLPATTRFGELKQPIHLRDFRGKTVVLAFFIKARTKG